VDVAGNAAVAYLGVPLVTRRGVPVGSFCVADREPRSWTPEQVGLLNDLAVSVMTEVEMRVERSAYIAGLAIERQRNAEETRRRQEEFQQIAEHVHEVFWVFDPGFSKVLFMSPAYEEVTGRSVESVYRNARSFLEPVHPEDLPRLLAAMERVAHEPLESALEFRVKHADGSLRWLAARGYPVRDESGVVHRVVGTTEDITQRKVAEEALRESEQRLQQIANASSSVFWIGTRSMSRFLYLSPAFEKIFARPREDVYANPFTLLESIHPEDRDTLGSLLRGGVQGRSVQFRVLRPDGSVRWVSTHANPVRDPTGEVVRIAGVAEDITGRRRAEHALRQSERWVRALFEHAVDGLSVHDFDGRVLDVNERLCAILGYTREEMLALTYGELEEHDGNTPFEGRWEALEPGVTVANEGLFRRKDGGTVPVEVRLTRVEQGRRAVVLATTRDVGERRALEDQLRQAQKMEALGRLAGGVAHDFNNQLTAILGFAKLLELEIPPGDGMQAYVNEIEKAAERSAQLIHQLLAFSRRQVLQPRLLDPNEVVSGVDLLLRRLVSRDVELVTIPGSSVGRVMADPSQLEQALVNLVLNARDALRGGGRVTVQTFERQLDEPLVRRPESVPPGSYVVLAVSDDGCGMDEATLERIFEPFFTTKDVGRGTGLGLAMVHGFVRQSGGRIVVHSKPGAGSTFKIYLPRVEEPARAPASIPLEATRSGSGTVLLVEDESAVRSLARAVLSRAGYQVLEAENGRDALRVWKEHRDRIQLVLTDVSMPLMGGRELARQIHVQAAGFPVLYMSGYTDEIGPEDDAEGFPLLPKPFTPQALLAHVATVLGEEKKA
jgi:two-component system, cell cycle sensor histidine kinase and response regulator CckA